MEALSAWTAVWCIIVFLGTFFFWFVFALDRFRGTALNGKPFGIVAGTWLLGTLGAYLLPIIIVVAMCYLLFRGAFWVPRTASFWIREYRNV